MFKRDFPETDAGEAAEPPVWVQRSHRFVKDVGWYVLAASILGATGPLKYTNMGIAYLLSELYALRSRLLDRVSWRKSQTDQENGAETSARQSMEDSETDEAGGSEVPLDDIKGEGADSLGVFPFRVEERSTPEPHHTTDDEEEYTEEEELHVVSSGSTDLPDPQ